MRDESDNPTTQMSDQDDTFQSQLRSTATTTTSLCCNLLVNETVAALVVGANPD